MTLQTFTQKKQEEYDKRFGKRDPEDETVSIGREAGCDDCDSNKDERDEHRAFLATAIREAIEDFRWETKASVCERCFVIKESKEKSYLRKRKQ